MATPVRKGTRQRPRHAWRLARLSKSVVPEVAKFLIGVNTLDLDVKRATETIRGKAEGL